MTSPLTDTRAVSDQPESPTAPLAQWTRAQLQAGGWVRQMFAQGQRLRAEHGENAVADLALGQPLGEPPAAVIEALRAAAHETHRGRHGYMPNLGYPEAREAVARDVAVAGVTGEHVILTGGAGAAVSLALRAVVNPGDEVIGIGPFFGEYATYCAAAGARWVPVSSRGDLSIDLDAMRAALSSRTAVMILNTPCNPTGHVTTGAEMAGLAAALEEHGARSGRRPVLVVDEVYRNLLYGDAVRVDPLAHYDMTLLARSFSKDLGLAGERIGYLAVHPAMRSQELMRGLELCQRALGFVNAPATMQRMLVHLLASGRTLPVDLATHAARRDAALRMARDAGLQPVAPDGGLYLWTPSPWKNAMAYVRALAARRVLVAPGVAFGADGWMRICFSAPEEVLRWALAEAGELARADESAA